MKKEKLNYFDEFIKSMEFSVKEVNLLKEILQDFNKETLSNNIERMHIIEHSADMQKHNLMEYLLKDFVPPIEREDIVELCHKIDNVTDNIEEILINFYILYINYLKEIIPEYIELLIKIWNSCYNLIVEFKNYKKSKKIFSIIIEINNLEEQADKLFIKNMRNLYKENNDTKDIIAWTKIYNCFEKCFDSCEGVSDTVETAILKNS